MHKQVTLIRLFCAGTLLLAFFTIPLISVAQSDEEEYAEEVTDAPSVNLTVDNQTGPLTVAKGARITVRWSSENTDSCKANWTRKKIKTSGKQTGRMNSSATFIIRCTGEDGEKVFDSVRVNLAQASAAIPNAEVKSAVPVSKPSPVSDSGGIRVPTDPLVSAIQTKSSQTSDQKTTLPVSSSGGHAAGVFTVRIDGKVGNTAPDELAKEFYVQYPGDNWDFLVFFESSPSAPRASHYPVKNEVKGIGRNAFDLTRNYGSAGRLRGVSLLFDPMNDWRSSGTYNIFLEETFAHSFGLFIGQSLGESATNPGHWSDCFSVPVPDQTSYWHIVDSRKNNGNGTWSRSPVPRDERGISRLDPFMLYFSGLLPSTDVPPMMLLEPTNGNESDCSQLETITATSRLITIHDVIAKHGPRVPSFADAQKSFSFAFILFTDKNGPSPSSAAIEKLNAFASEWPNVLRTMTSSINALPPLGVDVRVNGVESSTMVPVGGNAVLSWTSTNANRCILDGASIPTSGTETRNVGANPSFFYSVTCYQSGGDNVGVTDRVKVTVSGAATTSRQLVCGSLGDVNEDGNLSPADLDIISNFLSKDTPLTDSQKGTADLNGDGSISLRDYLLLRNYLDGFPTTFPGCLVTVDITANGQDALTATQNADITIMWTSANAERCYINDVPDALVGTITRNVGVSPSVFYAVTCFARGSNTGVTDTVTITVTFPPAISQPSLTVLSPNGGETLTEGQPYRITWSTTGAIKRVALEWVNVLGGTNSPGLDLAALEDNPGYYDWTPKLSYPFFPATGNYAIEVRDRDTPGVFDRSNNTFTITPIAPPVGKPLACGSVADLNNDGTLSDADLSIMLNFLTRVTTPTEEQKKQADLNLSGTLTIADTSLMSLYLLGKITTFAACNSNPVTVDFRVNGSAGPITVNVGSDVTLSWTSTNADRCSLDGVEQLATNGSVTKNVGTDVGTTGSRSILYGINCFAPGSNLGVPDRVEVNVVVQTTVDVWANGSDGPITVPANSDVTLSWTSTNADRCSLGSEALAASGSITKNVGMYSSIYAMNCFAPGSASSVSDSVLVNVASPSSHIFENTLANVLTAIENFLMTKARATVSH